VTAISIHIFLQGQSTGETSLEIEEAKVLRVELEPGQTAAIIAQLDEPYASLTRLLELLGRRIEEAIGVQPMTLTKIMC
jgi:hypothetical protein